VFKNPRDITHIGHLARQFYPKKISSFHKPYLFACNNAHTKFILGPNTIN